MLWTAPMVASLALLASTRAVGPSITTCSISITMHAKRKPAHGGGGFGARKPTRGGGGFGAPKPTAPSLDEIIASFKTRLPKDPSCECVCGSCKPYDQCCRPYHLLERSAESPEKCLRARYSAFAYRLPRFIIASTDKTNRDYRSDKVKWARFLDREQMFDSFQFDGLEIGRAEAGNSDREAFLTLSVTLREIDPGSGLPTQSLPQIFKERSKFVRTAKGAWLYASGDVTTEQAGLRGRSLNSEADVESLRKDVAYVSKVMKDPRKAKLVEQKLTEQEGKS